MESDLYELKWYEQSHNTCLEVKKHGRGIWAVSFDITNTGGMDAYETVQVYVGDPEASVKRPLKELKGYGKVFVKAGETVRVTVELDSEAFSFYDVDSKSFVTEPGKFVISVGPSSADLPLCTELMIK